ncbi:hypothetical protein DFH08DRAFT_852060 [Mycena albidolilacea]|uniref:Uncharacterized protein n=1 Tax=Mycena albidolilacea TaxID=1033008 RepID=A0AAD7EWJ4_9AGAR|nr:hypothetical protein DFH08DRAFT_852060 [Mycena albidolilacea]
MRAVCKFKLTAHSLQRLGFRGQRGAMLVNVDSMMLCKMRFGAVGLILDVLPHSGIVEPREIVARTTVRGGCDGSPDGRSCRRDLSALVQSWIDKTPDNINESVVVNSITIKTICGPGQCVEVGLFSVLARLVGTKLSAGRVSELALGDRWRLPERAGSDEILDTGAGLEQEQESSVYVESNQQEVGPPHHSVKVFRSSRIAFCAQSRSAPESEHLAMPYRFVHSDRRGLEHFQLRRRPAFPYLRARLSQILHLGARTSARSFL